MVEESITFTDLLGIQVDKRSNNTAYTFLKTGQPVSALSFADVAEQAQQVAGYLQRVLPFKARVLVAISSDEEYLLALLGCFYAGLTVIPLTVNAKDAAAMSKTIQDIGANAQTGFLLTTEQLQSKLETEQQLPTQITAFTIESARTSTASTYEKPQLSANPLAFILYTSGSTGQPKGVMIAHQNLISNIRTFVQHCDITVKDSMCVWVPNTHIPGLYCRLLGLLTGGKTFIFSQQEFLENPLYWLEMMSAYQATMTVGSNFAYELCVQTMASKKSTANIDLDLSHWHMAISGGEKSRLSTIERFQQQFGPYGFNKNAFRPYYGLTETGCVSITASHTPLTHIKIDETALANHRFVEISEGKENDSAVTLVSNGEVLANIDLQIVSPDTLQPCSAGEIGEIWVASEGNFLGYWQEADKTRQTCRAELRNVSTKDDKGSRKTYFRTGDLGILYHRQLYIIGRLRELVIIHGKNYYPDDIEQLVQQHLQGTQLQRNIALAIEANGKERLVLILSYIDALPRMQFLEELHQQLKALLSHRLRLEPYALYMIAESEIPKTSTGKIKRQHCRENIMLDSWSAIGSSAPDMVSSDVKSSTSLIEKALYKLTLRDRESLIKEYIRSNLSEILKQRLSPVQDRQPLWQFGFDAVDTVKIVMELQQVLGKQLSTDIFFNDTNIGTLSHELAQSFDKSEQLPICQSIEVESIITDYSSTCKVPLPSKKSLKKTQSFLLTGVNSFLGSYILHALLQSITDQFYCLTQANNSKEGFAQIKKALAINDWHYDEFFLKSRMTLVMGNLTEPKFDLSEPVYNKLCVKIDAILHNVADVNFAKFYQTLEAINTQPLQTLLHIASQHHLKNVYFISTAAVFNSPPRCSSLF